MTTAGLRSNETITFLGGANEVGASCTLLEVAGQRILIDAGIRMGAREGDQLPNLSQIQEVGPLDVILLTHAHTDLRQASRRAVAESREPARPRFILIKRLKRPAKRRGPSRSNK